MKRNKFVIYTCSLLATFSLAVVACKKDVALSERVIAPPVFPVVADPSFVEEFDNVSDLSNKGWAFKNNSFPIGGSGWRQGRYESANVAQYKFLAPVAFIGFPAFSATSTPNDFVSCDASCSSDAATGTSEISAWLISPKISSVKNGDTLTFYTRAIDDANYAVYLKDRMQVRANFSGDGSAEVGSTPTSIGNFTTLLLDINPNYDNNDPSGYPENWTKVRIIVSGIAGSGTVTNARFAFRYLGTDAGIFGGLAGTNYPSVVGIDQLKFSTKK